MKFTCLIASTLLIFVISQHTTIGLPIDDVTTERTCSKGFELVDGECLPIKSTLDKKKTKSDLTDVETVTMNDIRSVKKDEPLIVGACPEGKVHGKYGRCEDAKLHDELATTVETKEAHDTTKEHEKEPKEHEEKPKEHEEELKEHEEKLKEHEEKLKEHEKEPKDHEKEPFEHTTESLEVTSPLSDATTESIDTNDQKSHEDDMPKGCPPGTKPDEEGACQDEVEASSSKPTIDFKGFLSKDGSCPFGMELLNDKCIYIKSKQALKLQPLYSFDDYPSKDADNHDKKEELVPLLADNSCPEDTEYSSNGLCRKRLRPLTPHVVDEVKLLCLDGETLVDGVCKPVETETQFPLDVDTKTVETSEIAPEKKPTKHTEKINSAKSKRHHF